MQFIRDGDVWKKLWKIPAMPKMTNMLWRAAINSLPTMDRLLTKRAITSNVCQLCNRATETIMHLLVSCDIAKDVWGRSRLGWFYGNIMNFVEWLDEMLKRVERNRWGEIATLC